MFGKIVLCVALIMMIQLAQNVNADKKPDRARTLGRFFGGGARRRNQDEELYELVQQEDTPLLSKCERGTLDTTIKQMGTGLKHITIRYNDLVQELRDTETCNGITCNFTSHLKLGWVFNKLVLEVVYSIVRLFITYGWCLGANSIGGVFGLMTNTLKRIVHRVG